MSANILDLADELLVLICASIESRNTLYSLMRVCRRLNGIAEPLLYKSVLLRDTQDNISFERSISTQPERAQQIQTLALHVAAAEEFEPVSVIPCLALTTNLQELSVDSPNEENDVFDGIFTGALLSASSPLLTCLRKCILPIQRYPTILATSMLITRFRYSEILGLLRRIVEFGQQDCDFYASHTSVSYDH
jgi:hypothetical protein